MLLQIVELDEEVEDLFVAESVARNHLEKTDILKKITEKRTQLEKLKKGLPRKTTALQRDAQQQIDCFDKTLEIQPILLVNIVLKF